MKIEKKIKRSLSLFDKFLENADEATLNYLGMTEKERQIILASTYDIQSDPETAVMAINYDVKDNHATFYYNPAIKTLEQNHVTKIVLHELGHVHEPLREDDDMAKLANTRALSWLYQNRWSKSFRETMDTITDVSLETSPVVGALIFFGSYALIGLGLYPARQMENKCDDFADKIMPEITYADNDKATYAAMNEAEDGEIESQAGRFIALSSTHPSTYYRKKRSKKKCVEYTQTKKELNAASVYLETKKKNPKLEA